MAFTLLSYLLVFSAEAGPFNEAAQKELKTLEGDWSFERLEANGKKHEPGGGERGGLTIKGTKWSFQPTGEEAEIVALDPSCNPKLIDLKIIKAGQKPIIREGIYKLDGDTLTMVIYQGQDKKRPTRFDTPAEGGTVLFVFKRAKR
jgi:uncharacterized protein (TIGR03067 family)